jgi:type I restriction enzyme S subunit
MPDKLPNGWAWASFSDLFQVASDGGQRLPQSEYKSTGKFPVIDQGEKDPGGFTDEDLAYEGELPVILFGDHTRRFKLVEYPFVVGAQGVKILQPSREVPVRFLWLAVNALKIESRGYSRHFQFLKKARIPLAPTLEQERIVAKLDALLSRVSAGETAARRALERLKRYRAAVLHAAVTGELTRDWRKTHQPQEAGAQLLKLLLTERRARWEEAELKRLHAAGKPPKTDKWKRGYPEPTNLDTEDLLDVPRGWSWATLDQIAQEGRPILYGIIKPGPHDPNGVPYVRVMEMKDGKIDVNSLKKASRARAAKFARATLAAGDVLISKDGTIGRVAVVPPELAGGNITQHVMRAPIHAFIWRDFVVAAIRSDWCQRWLTGETRGVALQGVNVGDFRRLPIPIPPFPEQREIEREVERRLSVADRLATTLEFHLLRVRALRQSVLREAFAGNLVPQEANDEPASVLLQRIRDARKAEAKGPKPKRMPKKRIPAKTSRRALLDVLREHGEPMTPEELFKRAGYAEPIEPAELSDPIKAVEAFFAEVSRLTRESVLIEKRSAYDRGLVQLEVKK